MGFFTSLIAYLTGVAAFSGMALATLFYLISPPDLARVRGPETKQPAEAKTGAAIGHARNPASRQKTSAVNEAKAPAPSRSQTVAATSPAPAARAEPSTAPSEATVGLGSSASERKPDADARRKTAKKPKKVAKKRAVPRRAPRDQLELWDGRYAGRSFDRPYYQPVPSPYGRGAFSYEQGPYWYR